MVDGDEKIRITGDKTQKLSLLLITYDIGNDKMRKKVCDQIEEYDHAIVTESTYLVESDMEPDDLYKEIKTDTELVLGKMDRFYVFPFHADTVGGRGPKPELRNLKVFANLD